MNPHRRFSSPEKPVNFLKIILSDQTRTKGIRLPVKFTEEYGNNLSKRVTLKVRNGDVWQVDIHKSGDEIWLKNGWGKFAEHYGLGFSNMLMFKYEGFSTFCVVIFNASASEIEYPENTDRHITSVKRNASKCPVSCDDDSSSLKDDDQEHGVKIEDEGECSTKIQRRKEGRRVIKKGKTESKCDKLLFMVYINKSHLTNRGVELPAGLGSKLLKGNPSRKCVLQLKNDEETKAWKVVAKGGYLGNADWLRFVEDNDVKVEDICVFELIHKDKNVLTVGIRRSG